MTEEEREYKREQFYHAFHRAIEKKGEEITWREIGKLCTLCIGRELGFDEMAEFIKGVKS